MRRLLVLAALLACAKQPGAPAAVSIVSATAGIRSATVTFTESPGATEYGVDQSDDGATWTPAQAAVSGDTANITGLLDGATYYFSISARNGVGASPRAVTAAVETPNVPSAPHGMSAAGNVVSWSAPDKGPVTGYVVLQSSDGFTWQVADAAISGTSATVNGLSTGSWQFAVYASNAVGNSPLSDPSAPVSIP